MLLSALAERGDIPQVPEVLVGTGPTAARPTAKLLEDVAGTYLAAGAAVRVVARPDGTLGTENLVKGTWVPGPYRYTYRSDGQFWATDAPYSSLSLQRGWGRTYLVLQRLAGSGQYRVNFILGQRVTSASDASSVWHQRLDETWLNVNERPDSILWHPEPTLSLTTIPGLPGILWIDGGIWSQPVDARTSDDRAAMFLQIPQLYGRDLNDLRVIEESGEEWVTFGSSTFRPASGVPALALGPNAVTVGPDGYADWRTVPAAMSITVSGATAWKAYGADAALIVDGDSATSPVLVPNGGRIVVFGPPGTTIGVDAA